MFAEIPIKDRFSLPPNAGGTARALSRVGYDLAQALSDLIDNSIDASANIVSIVFYRDDQRITAVTVTDNGRGMDSKTLDHAMQFGVQANHEARDLGTFGLGLKSASLSQCKTLTVVTRQSGSVSACRWNSEAMKSDWTCEHIDPVSAGARMNEVASDNVDVSQRGTLVSWERLDRLGVKEADIERFLSKQLDSLELHFGLYFHRFLSDKRLSILVSAYHVEHGPGLPRQVSACDPFAYRKSGERAYPKTFVTSLSDVGAIELIAHIWPPDAVEPQFRLGRKIPTPFQGLYFYRNDRLIQAGGWNGLLRDSSDPELVLARVKVDLPEGLILDAVNVQKTALQLSASLAEALEHATCDGATLHSYFDTARRVYRAGAKKSKQNGNLPLVPCSGLPIRLQQAYSKILARDSLHRAIDFEWIPLGTRKIFEFDRSEDKIYLNQKFRSRILQGKRGSTADAPLLKVLFFLLLQDEFNKERQSAKQKEWVDRCNAILLRAVKLL
jgi:Histidine kinase-, DNA gyrase B-, and HSP90-like ATPase